MDASAGSILNDEDAGTYLAAATADLDALNDIGAAGDKLDTMVDNLEADAANIYTTEADGVTLDTLAAVTNIDIDNAAGDIIIDTVSAGGTAKIDASAGSILNDGDTDSYLTAMTADIDALTNIGAVGDKLDTDVTTLQADAANIYISEADGITLDTLVAVTDIDIDNAADDIIVDTVTAGGAVTMDASAGSILNDGDTGTYLAAATADLDALNDIGAAGDKLDTEITTLQADAANIYITEADGITLNTLAADTDIDIDNSAGDIIVDTVTSGGAVTIEAVAGSINESMNDDIDNITTPGAVTLAGETGIGNLSMFDLAGVTNLTLDTNGNLNLSTDAELRDLSVTVDPAGGSQIYALADSGNLTWNVTDNLLVDADLNLNNVSAAAGDLNFALATDSGNINVGTVGAGAGTVAIEAANGSILDDSFDFTRITAGTANITAGNGSIGGSSFAEWVDTNVDNLSAYAPAGSVYIQEFANLSSADIIADQFAYVIAAGSISDTDGNTDIAAANGYLSAGSGDVGGSGVEIDTDVDTLQVFANNGSIYIDESDDIALNTVTAGGSFDITAGQMTIGFVEAIGTATLDSSGSIAGPGILVADTADLTATGDIGTDTDSLNTAVTTLLADAANIYIAESDDITLNTVTAGGSFDITAGQMTIGSVGVTGTATLDSFGSIAGPGTLTADTADLTATGNIGGSTVDRLDTSVNTLLADAANIYIAESDDITLDTVTAGGSFDITAGQMTIGAVGATGTATLDSSGSIAGPGTLVADTADLTATGDIGTDTDRLDTSVNTLLADAANIYIAESDDITLDTVTAGGSFDITAGQMTIGTVGATGTAKLDSSGSIVGPGTLAADTADLTATGDIGSEIDRLDTSVNTLLAEAANIYISEADSLTGLDLDAGSGDVIINAGAITDSDENLDISASLVDVTAASFGSGADSINTNVADLKIDTSGSDGDQYISQTGAITALNLNAGSGSVTLSADSITDSDYFPTDISASSADITATNGDIGGSEFNERIETDVDTLTVNAINGSIYIAEADTLTVAGPAVAGNEIKLTAQDTITLDDTVTAHGNIMIQSTGGDIVAKGSIDATGGSPDSGGGVSLRADYGMIYTPDAEIEPGVFADDTLNVAVTGYSDDTQGVPFPFFDVPIGGTAAIAMRSMADLKLGPAAELTAKGISSGDERSGVFFKDAGSLAGDPVDIGIYLFCYDNHSAPPFPVEGGIITVDSSSISSPGGAVVFDARNSVYFGDNFESYLAAAPEISRIEVVSRQSATLNDVLGPGTPDLPHAGEEEVFWNLIEGPDKGYVLRGDFDAFVQGKAHVLGFVEATPLASFALQPPEIESAQVESVDLDELLAWLVSEFGENAKTYFADAYRDEYSTEMIPIKSALRLRELSSILGDYEAYIAALMQVVGEFAGSEQPMAPEQLDATRQAIALHFNAGDDTHYAMAGQWLNAIAEYFSILTNTETGEYTEIGMPPMVSLGHIMTRYIGPAQRNTDERVVEYIDTYIELLGS
jgi:hypothetical protein